MMTCRPYLSTLQYTNDVCTNSRPILFKFIEMSKCKDKDEFYSDFASNFYSIFNFHYLILFFKLRMVFF